MRNNAKLKDLLFINPDEMNPDLQEEFFDELKKAEFLMPVKPPNNRPAILRDNFKTFLPLFTDEDEMKHLGDVKTVVRSASEIAHLLESDKSIVEVVINPACDKPIGINHEHFIYHCKNVKFNNIFNVIEHLQSKARPLEENKIFYLREKTPFMKNNSKDGVYVSPIPFSVTENDDYHREYDYLNRIFVPKGTMYMKASELAKTNEEFHDIILAPVLKFELVESSEMNTFIWQCVNQDFTIYEE